MKTRRITRRLVLGSVGAASLSPALRGEMRADAPRSQPTAQAAPGVTPAFVADLEIGPLQSDERDGRGWAVVSGGQLRGARLSATVTTGRVEYRLGARGATPISSSLLLRSDSGELLELRQRVLPAATRASGDPVNLHCEIVRAGPDAAPWPAVLIGRLDASSMAEGRLRAVVFEVV